jgi:hypothetical protein
MATISLDSGELLSLAEAARTLPGRPGPSTLWRWRTRGIRGVRLATVLIGGRRYVSKQALAAFAQRLTDATDPQLRDEAASERSPATAESLHSAGLL